MGSLNTSDKPDDTNNFLVTFAKTIVAGLLISALITYTIKSNGNTTPVWVLMAISFAIMLAVLAFVIVLAYPSAQFRQWTLRQGAVDSQWLFFNANPPGFDSEKAQYQAKAQGNN